MIELPEKPAPNGITPTLIDYSVTQRPATGGAVQTVSRPGSRFRVAVSFPPMKGDTARAFIARLLRAKREGLRLKFPLLDVDQGAPGAPVVDTAGQAGTSLKIRGLNPSYLFKEGFWLSIIDTAGQRYLHNVTAPAVADGAGKTTIQIEPPLRFPFPDGAQILMQPEIDGFIDGDEWGWSIDIARHYGITVILEESA